MPIAPCALLDTRDDVSGISIEQLFVCIRQLGRGVLNIRHSFVINDHTVDAVAYLQASRNTNSCILGGFYFLLPHPLETRTIPRELCKLPVRGPVHPVDCRMLA